jgi:NAD+ diphosphatase
VLPALLPSDVAFENTRFVGPLLSPIECEQVLYATALAEWQRRSAHCPRCGAGTALDAAGHSRTCGGCGSTSWPRQDPSIIVAVSSRDGRRILLARSPRHPPSFHTALAGFAEAGETLEQAVAREVYEETALRVDAGSVRYVASQPWPFPQSTMIGFVATADDRNQEIRIDPTELVGAAWFTKDQVRAASRIPGQVVDPAVARRALEQHPDAELLIPRGVLARQLIEHWLNSDG